MTCKERNEVEKKKHNATAKTQNLLLHSKSIHS